MKAPASASAPGLPKMSVDHVHSLLWIAFIAVWALVGQVIVAERY